MSISYRLGFPGWQFFAMLRVPIRMKIDVCHDVESKVWIATCDPVGLAVEADTLDDLVKEIHSAASELVPLSLERRFVKVRPEPDIRVHGSLMPA